MARPANANPDETRQRLVDAAIGLFAQHGFHGASVRELVKAAGVNVATVNYYFRSKQGLYDACVDEVYRRLRARASTVNRSDLGLDSLMWDFYVAARMERDGVRLLVRQVLDHGRLTGRTEAAHFLPVVENVSRLAAELLGCSVDKARTGVVAIGYLLSRYVIQDDRSLRSAFGVRTAKEAQGRAVATLVALARSLLEKNR